MKLILGDKSFQVAAPRLWNTLPSEIRAIISLAYDLFKEASLDVNHCSRKHLLDLVFIHILLQFYMFLISFLGF